MQFGNVDIYLYICKNTTLMQVYIYCLRHPISNEIRYIGKTTNYKRRLSSHISEAKVHKGRRHVLNWIYSLLQINLKPTIEVLEVCDSTIWQDREQYWIAYYREQHTNLCNIADGGLGGSGEKNYTEEELEERKIVMSLRMSKFSESDKLHIWKLIQGGKSLIDIQQLYPSYSRQMDFGVRNGRQWNMISGIPKTKGSPKRKYVYNQGRYIIRDKNRKVIFSSKNEQDVIDYLVSGQAVLIF